MLAVEILVVEFLAVDGFAASAVASSKISSLEHETWDDTMERRALIAVAFFTSAKSTEVGGASRRNAVVELEDYCCWGTTIHGYVEIDIGGLRV